MLPHSVHEDATGEWMGGAGNPSSQFKATALLFRNRRGDADTNRLWERARRDVALTTDLAASKQRYVHDFVVQHSHRHWQRLAFFVQRFQFAFDRAKHPLIGQFFSPRKPLLWLLTRKRRLSSCIDLRSYGGKFGLLRLELLKLLWRQRLVEDLLSGNTRQHQKVATARNPRSSERAEERLRAGKDSCHPVIVFHRKRIELVMMATGTRDGTSHDRPCQRIDLLVNQFRCELRVVVLAKVLRADGKEPGCCEQSSPLGVSVEWKQVAGNLFGQKTIIRNVRIDRVDHVVAIPPCIGERYVRFAAAGFTIASNIQPMSSPAFTKLR